MERYLRQIALGCLGEQAQRRLARARAVVVGCGATGGALAELLARAGVGRLRVIDRDLVDRTNLQRQRLFDDADARAARPKALAAAARLEAINPEIEIEPVLADLNPANARALLGDAECVLDGTDNFATRLLMNDACIEAGTPWVYTGVVGTVGHTMPIVPGRTACLRCYLPAPPPPGAVPTCESAGVLGAAVDAVAGFAAAEAIKLLAGAPDAVVPGLLVLDVWARQVRRIEVPADPDCPCCGARRFEFLAAGTGTAAAALCGRNAVHVPAPPGAPPPDFAALAARLERAGLEPIRLAERLLRFRAGELEVSVFPDGRAIVRGTEDPARARALYSRYLGG
ncbi:MAG: molybdopterin biosynthesis protein MoeB [Planctomycetota bacterium]|nr:MAG: molybdopterin biosynthesis protein MoeB [Planctomycetota bacterium]